MRLIKAKKMNRVKKYTQQTYTRHKQTLQWETIPVLTKKPMMTMMRL